jgi:polysaccharide pyruvyl transferase WcaK-like protein
MLPAPKPRCAKRVVGVGLITYLNRRCDASTDDTVYRDYIAKLGDFVIWLIERKYVVRLLIGDVVYDGQARRDLRTFVERRGISYESGQIIDEPAASVDEVLSQIGATDIVVASRFHNVLLALLLGKPVLALSYHEKVQALMAESEIGEFCQDIESIDLEKMTRQFASLENQSTEIVRRLQQRAEAYRAVLDEQYGRIFRTSLSFERGSAFSTASSNT